ncbi:MAG: hypothetical protein ACRDV9_06815 [Acidimicrobiia bacterium]
MGASVSLLPELLRADPGSEAFGQVRIRNTGTVVDEFSLSVLGDAAPWASIEPSTVSLFPGAEELVALRFRPPRAATTKEGPVPFGVKVASREDPRGSVVEEGTLQVGRFTDVFAELVPRTSRGRFSARHDLAVDNRGNIRVNATVSAKDADNALTFEFEPPAVVADPDTATFARVKVQPRKRFLKGPARTYPFQVSVESEGAPTQTADGTLLQEQLAPKWIGKALLILLLLVAAWFLFLKKVPESAARKVAEMVAKEAAEEAIQGPIAAQGAKIANLEQGTTGTTTPPVSTDGGTTGGGGGGSTGDPFDRRLAVSAPAGQTGREAFAVEEGKVFSLTDLVLQNPAGDAGILEVRRGDGVILRVNLANFRDLDYHFVSPVVFGEKEQVVLAVECANPAGSPACSPAAYLSGFLGKAPSV